MRLHSKFGLKFSGESSWWPYPNRVKLFFWRPEGYWVAFGWDIHRWVFRLWVGHV